MDIDEDEWLDARDRPIPEVARGWWNDPHITSERQYLRILMGTDPHPMTPDSNSRNDPGGIDYSAQSGIPLYSWIKRRGD